MADNSPGIVTLTIKDKNSLFTTYMPFVKNGGVFIPTQKPYKLGAEATVLLILMDNKERLPVTGRLVWITPQGA
jgi:type IV pilus assembly protein PilZ